MKTAGSQTLREHKPLNGAGVESMQAKWDEMFGEKEEEEVVEDVKIKRLRNKTANNKTKSNK